MIKIVTIFILYFLVNSMTLADVGVTPPDAEGKSEKTYTIYIEGEIKKGDYEKLFETLKMIYEKSKPNNYKDLLTIDFSLNTEGGSVMEAIRIARLIDKLKIEARIALSAKCYSSCVYIFLASIDRSKVGKLGIHRPYYEKSQFSKLSLKDANKLYDDLNQIVKSFLLEMGAPNGFIEDMFLIPSNDIKFITSDDYPWISQNSPAFEEWLISKCGSMSPDEQDEYSAYLVDKMLGKKSNLSAGYLSYLTNSYKKIKGCRYNAIWDERISQAEMIFK